MRRLIFARLGLAIWLAPGVVEAAPAPEPESIPTPDDEFEPVPIQAPEAPPPPAEAVKIRGVVTHAELEEPIEGARVIAQCECATRSREVVTDADGVYSFGELPAGDYVITVLSGKAEIRKHIDDIPAGAKLRANFTINPEAEVVIDVIVTLGKPPGTTQSQAKKLPVGARKSGCFYMASNRWGRVPRKYRRC